MYSTSCGIAHTHMCGVLCVCVCVCHGTNCLNNRIVLSPLSGWERCLTGWSGGGGEILAKFLKRLWDRRLSWMPAPTVRCGLCRDTRWWCSESCIVGTWPQSFIHVHHPSSPPPPHLLLPPTALLCPVIVLNPAQTLAGRIFLRTRRRDNRGGKAGKGFLNWEREREREDREGEMARNMKLCTRRKQLVQRPPGRGIYIPGCQSPKL